MILQNASAQFDCSNISEHNVNGKQENFKNLKKKYFSIVRKDLKRTSNKLNHIFPPHGDGRLNGELVSATVAASAMTILSDLTGPSELRKSNLHEYRLKVKELRNVLQMGENRLRELRGCCPATGWRDFFLSRSAFNRFAHANRKLPCSTLSGVECLSLPYTPCAARPGFDLGSYRTATHRNRPGSASESAAKRIGIRTPVRTGPHRDRERA